MRFENTLKRRESIMKTRKLFVAALALVLTPSMTATAFAAAGNEKATSLPYSKDIDVTGTYSGTTLGGDVYSVDISWDAMAFTYAVVSGTQWNPSTHEYVSGAAPGWTSNNNTITTVNHSNVPVDVALTFTKNTELNAAGDTFEGSFDKASYNLVTAESTTYDNAPRGTSALTFTGALDASHTTSVKLGTITVSLSKATVTP